MKQKSTILSQVGILRFHPPLTMAVLVETPDAHGNQVWSVSHDALGIRAFGWSRERLLRELHDEIAVLWEEYALAPDGDLSPAARGLKAALLERITADPCHRVWFKVAFNPLLRLVAGWHIVTQVGRGGQILGYRLKPCKRRLPWRKTPFSA